MRGIRSIFMVIAILAGLLALSAVASFAADAASPADELKALKSDYDAAQQKFQAAYSAAKTDAEREKIAETYPKADVYGARMMALADKAPKSDVEREAMVWILQKLYYTPSAEKAIERLQANHIKSPDLEPALQMIAYSQAASAPGFLRAIIKENPGALAACE